MKRIKASQLPNVAAAGLHTGLLASALAAAAMIGGAHAAETRGGVAGKVAYCLDCHGAAGQGYRGYYPMPAPRRATTGISEKPAAGLCRAQAHQQHHVKCRAFVEPGDDCGAWGGIPRARSKTARRRSKEPGRDPMKELFKTAFPTPMSPPARPATGLTRKAPGKFPVLPGNCLITRSTSWSTGARNAAKTLQSPIRRRSCRRWRTA